MAEEDPAHPIRSMFPGLTAAALFGASPPLSKLLLAGADPVWAASLLYLGSGAGLLIGWGARRAFGGGSSTETPLRRGDLWYLAAAIGCGGVLAPVLLMLGLKLTQASSASLLLNMEAIFTALLAWVLFREGFERRVALGMALVVIGCAALSLPEKLAFGSVAGPLLVAGACGLWAIDNNLTRGLSGRDPVQVAMLKGMAGGGVTAATAILLRKPWPAGLPAGGLLLLGAFAYGLSLVLFIRSLRGVGTVRTGMAFAAAPFVGAALSFVLLGDRLTPGFAAGLVLMVLGLYLTLSVGHVHEHEHEAVVHDHAHVHDDHHRHDHAEGPSSGEPHAHPHEHAALRHAHPHYPDAHHRHVH